MHTDTKKTTKVLTPKQSEKLQQPLPQSWFKAAGILKNKRKALEKHISAVRAEWSKK